MFTCCRPRSGAAGAMANVLARLPYNRGAKQDAEKLVSGLALSRTRLSEASSAQRD
jgi:hypothetical protein